MAPDGAFVHRTRIAFHQADPAGVLFFGRYAELWQSAYEAFIADLGIPYDDWFSQRARSTPIRRVEVDHLRPILAGEAVEVRVGVARLGRTSFTLSMTASVPPPADAGAVLDGGGDDGAGAGLTDVRAVATITFVHTEAAADGGFEPAPMPPAIRDRFATRSMG